MLDFIIGTVVVCSIVGFIGLVVIAAKSGDISNRMFPRKPD